MRAFLLRSIKTATARSLNRSSFSFTVRWFDAKCCPPRKVTILGAGTSLGQRTALLMKLNPLISKLSLYDVAGSDLPTVACAGHATRAKVVGHLGERRLGKALKDSDLVIMAPSLESQRLGRTDHEVSADTGIIESLCTAVTQHCPQAIVNIISNPVASVPIAAEVLKKAGLYDENKLLGIFTSGCDKENQALSAYSDEVTKLVKVTTGKDLEIVYAAAIVADLCLRTLNRIPDNEEASFVQPESYDNIGLVLCVSKSEETNSDLTLEWFSQWRIDRRFKLYDNAPKDKTIKARDRKDHKAPKSNMVTFHVSNNIEVSGNKMAVSTNKVLTEAHLDDLMNAPEDRWPEVAPYLYRYFHMN